MASNFKKDLYFITKQCSFKYIKLKLLLERENTRGWLLATKTGMENIGTELVEAWLFIGITEDKNLTLGPRN